MQWIGLQCMYLDLPSSSSYYKEPHRWSFCLLSGEFSRIGLGMVMVKVLIARLTPYIPLLLVAEN